LTLARLRRMRSQFRSWRRLSPCAGANIHVLLRGRCSFTIRRVVFDRHVLARMRPTSLKPFLIAFISDNGSEEPW